MSRMHNLGGMAEPERETTNLVDTEHERVSDGSVRDISSAQTPADSMTRDAVLASCMRKTWSIDPESMVSFGARERTRVTEEFRALRSRLSQLQRENPFKSVLVTSALPKEGKSFVAANLAQTMALQSECRVLLIDADLHNPRLHQALGTSSTPGFSEFLLQEVDDFGIMQRGEAENLFFIPAGRSVTGPTELVANGRLKSLIERVEPLFDWIVIDSPPAVPVSDATLIANCCDGVLMVVRSHSTPFDLVRKARDRFREESLVGVVLNVVEGTSAPTKKGLAKISRAGDQKDAHSF
jgi:protein-tyrosine kinase